MSTRSHVRERMSDMRPVQAWAGTGVGRSEPVKGSAYVLAWGRIFALEHERHACVRTRTCPEVDPRIEVDRGRSSKRSISFAGRRKRHILSVIANQDWREKNSA